MSSVVLRRLAVAGVATLAVAAPVSAYAAPHGGAHATKPSHATKSSHGNKHHGKPAQKHFTAVGTVANVDPAAGTVTINDKGGSKDLHGQPVTVIVTDTTKITRDDATVTLDKIQPGDHVSANGNRGTNGLTAKHVNAESPEAPDSTDSSETTTTSSTSTSSSSTDSSSTSTDSSSTSTTTTDTTSSTSSSSSTTTA